MQSTRRCHHIHANGSSCQAAPLHDKLYCYYHHTRERRRKRWITAAPLDRENSTGINLPMLEDADSVLIANQEIIQALLENRIDDKRAKILLSALHIALIALKRATPPNDACVKLSKRQEAEEAAEDRAQEQALQEPTGEKDQYSTIRATRRRLLESFNHADPNDAPEFTSTTPEKKEWSLEEYVRNSSQ